MNHITTGILIAVGIWHALAAWHFCVYPERTLRRTTKERPVNTFAKELFRFLGGMNIALVVLAGAALLSGHDVIRVALAVFAVANLSQFVFDVRVKRLGLAKGPFFATIYWGDLFFFLACSAILAVDILTSAQTSLTTTFVHEQKPR